MRLGKYIKRIKRYFVGGDEESLQTMPEVSRAMAEDSPRSIRFTLWAIGAFFLFFILWAGLANIDEVTRGDGKAIPSSRLQKNPKPGRRHYHGSVHS